MIIRKEKYEQDFKIFDKRNNYSKINLDATFMLMKDDYMQNRQLKTGYNVQIATECQFTLVYNISSNPTDTLTLSMFLNEIKQNYFELPKHIVADAGYGSKQNYNDILVKLKREALTTYKYQIGHL